MIGACAAIVLLVLPTPPRRARWEGRVGPPPICFLVLWYPCNPPRIPSTQPLHQAKRTAVHLRWTMLRMAEGELPPAGTATLRGNDAVPLMLACRTVAKAAAKLAMGAESNEAEVQVQYSTALQ